MFCLKTRSGTWSRNVGNGRCKNQIGEDRWDRRGFGVVCCNCKKSWGIKDIMFQTPAASIFTYWWATHWTACSLNACLSNLLSCRTSRSKIASALTRYAQDLILRLRAAVAMAMEEVTDTNRDADTDGSDTDDDDDLIKDLAEEYMLAQSCRYIARSGYCRKQTTDNIAKLEEMTDCKFQASILLSPTPQFDWRPSCRSVSRHQATGTCCCSDCSGIGLSWTLWQSNGHARYRVNGGKVRYHVSTIHIAYLSPFYLLKTSILQGHFLSPKPVIRHSCREKDSMDVWVLLTGQQSLSSGGQMKMRTATSTMITMVTVPSTFKWFALSIDGSCHRDGRSSLTALLNAEEILIT